MTTNSPDLVVSSPPERAEDEFYIGYRSNAPARIRRSIRRAVGVIVIGSVLVGAGLAAAFRSPGPATWSSDVTIFAGRLLEHPYPQLRMTDAHGQVRRVLLVQTGKHGAAGRVAGLDGREIRVRGTTLERDGRSLIEIADAPDAITPVDSATTPELPLAASIDRGRVTIPGEIIDPKCFLGAMKPGDGKLHKACAIRCISGGIPPMLAARNSDGRLTYYLLLTSNGAAVQSRVLPFVAESVELTGHVREVEGQFELWLDDDPAAIRRVP